MAVRSLFRQGKRYQLLGLAITFSFFIIVLVAAILVGMIGSLEEKAKVYYGGDLSIRGAVDGWNMVVKDGPSLGAVVRSSLGPGPVISERYEYRNTSTMLFFGGESVRQRILIGIDFTAEAELFSRLNYVQGNAVGVKGTNGILISEPIARLLKVRVGDDLLLLIPTLMGEKNTASVVVRGIFRDSSLFGYYTSYLDVDVLRDLVGMPKEFCTQIAIFFPGGRPPTSLVNGLQHDLEGKFNFFPHLERRQTFIEKAAQEKAPGSKYALLGLDANLDEVLQLLEAVYAVAFSLIAILLGVVLLGVSGSYRVIVYERTNEIGTMRAIGMQRGAAARLLMVEAAILAILGSLVGGSLAWMAMRLVGTIDLSFIPSFDIFLRGGRIEASLPLGLAFALTGLLVATAVIAVAGPARHAARIDPSEAMRNES